MTLPKLAVLVTIVALPLFILLMRQPAPVHYLTTKGVPSSVYNINGATIDAAPASGSGTGSITTAPIIPKAANLLATIHHITSEFGHYPNGEPHYGIDIDAQYGEIQYAPVGGVVTDILRGCVEGDTTCGKGWGNHIWFKSDQDGKYILLAHYRKIFDDIQLNAHFDAGRPLGETGATGYATGPHVHLQVNPTGMQNAGSENPAWEFPWLRCGEPTLGALFGSACN